MNLSSLAGVGFLPRTPRPKLAKNEHSSRFSTAKHPYYFNVCSSAAEFPSFVPEEMEDIKDPFARKLGARIERLPVECFAAANVKFSYFNSNISAGNSGSNNTLFALSLSNNCIMSSCIKPSTVLDGPPVVLLHGFDRYTLPLLEEAGLETWAVDVLGWGFSDLEKLPSCSVASKRDHLYQFWRSHIKRPMILVGPSLGAAVSIDFAVNHPDAVDKLVLIDASVYAEGTGNLATLPKLLAYSGVYLLKSVPLRLYATSLAFNGLPWDICLDWMNIGRLHCLLPWWADATVNFMTSGGYNVTSLIKQVNQKTLIIWGENDQIIDYKLAVRLHSELPNAIIRQIPDCGHIPHVEKPNAVSKLITEFVQGEAKIEKKELALSSLEPTVLSSEG